MTLRRILFWIHLTAGCLAGLVILAMSVTGVLLAYRRQVINWSDRSFHSQAAVGTPRVHLEELLAGLQQTQGRTPTAITVRSDSAAPVAFDFGRERTVFVDPYTGQVLGEGSRKLRAFFSAVEDWHRWLGAGGARRPSGRAVTGACNFAFLILVTTGPFLWWPKEWTWNNLRKIVLFRGGAWGRARDWNWHNVVGFWCVAPLFLIVITGVIMSYGWATNLLYSMTGNTPPAQVSLTAQGPAEREGLSQRRNPSHGARSSETPRFGELDKLFARAGREVLGWTTITLRLPNTAAGPLTFSIDRGNGSRPDLRSQLTLDPVSGEMVRWEPLFQLQPRTATTHVGPLHSYWRSGRLAWPNPRSCRFHWRFSTGVYRPFAWVATAPGLEDPASFANRLTSLESLNVA